MNVALSWRPFPSCPEEVKKYAWRSCDEYGALGEKIFEACPSLEVVTWGFGTKAKRWWHMPAGYFDEGGAGMELIIEGFYGKISISSNAEYDKAEFFSPARDLGIP